MNNNFLIIFTIFFIFSCTSTPFKPEVFKKNDSQENQYIIFGTITDLTNVLIEDNKEVETPSGPLVGIETDSVISIKNGVELLIETDKGSFISIIQVASDFKYFKEQKVRIIKRNGRSRVIPFK